MKPISNHCRGKHIFTSLRSQGEAKTNWGWGAFTSTLSVSVSSSLYLGTFLMKYLSPAACPVVTVQLFLPHLMFSRCSIQPLSLLAWLPAMPGSFQQTPLSASWSYMNKTSSNFETMACFAMCLYVSVKHKSTLCSCVSLDSMQICRFWNELKLLYLQLTIKAWGSWCNIQQRLARRPDQMAEVRVDPLCHPLTSQINTRGLNICHFSKFVL